MTRVQIVGFEMEDGEYELGGLYQDTGFVLRDEGGGVHVANYDPAAPGGTFLHVSCTACGRFSADTVKAAGQLIWFCRQRGSGGRCV